MAPGTDVVTAAPRKALDGEVPRRLLVVVVPGDAPEGGEAGLEMAEECVGLRRMIWWGCILNIISPLLVIG